LAAALPGYAQLATGSIYGTVQDEQGAALPGATATLTGAAGSRSTTVDATGAFRFLSLDPGTYKVMLAMSGFSNTTRTVVVNTGANVNLTFALKVAQLEETVTVEAETPVIDPKKTGTATNFTQDELLKVPNSRDPWALLRTVPGMVLDRVNIAGNESGQQSAYKAKGAMRSDGVWNMDGVNITDMSATGAAPTYFDYDAFEEIQIATGGNDIRQPTGGVGVNFVTKRGTNSFHGTARGYYTEDGLEACNVPDELTARGVTCETADHNNKISDYGFDLGGPILKDRLWFWASYGKQDIRLVRSAAALIDRTILKDFNVKLNWQATSKDMVNVMWFNGSKEKFGRAPGYQSFEASTAVWNQGNLDPEDKPPGLWKIEDHHSFSSNLFLNAKYAYYGTGFTLKSTGDPANQAGQSTRTSSTTGSTVSQYFLRPQHTANLDASWFKGFWGGNHELKFGAGFRTTLASSQVVWPGDKVVALDNSATDKRARLYREGFGQNRAYYWSFYVADTYTRDRLTLNVGLRYDRQNGEAISKEVGPNLAFPNVVPGVSFVGYDTPFTWSDISPRVGLTYALGESRRTLLRASYAHYVSQLPNGDVGYLNTAGSVGFADYPWVDLNGDTFAQPNEVVFTPAPITFGGGFNPTNPTAVVSPNQFDPDFASAQTDELIVGFDHELAPNLGVSVSYTYRNYDRFVAVPRIGFSDANYAPGTPATGTLADRWGGSAYSIPTYIPDAALVLAHGGGRIRTNRDGYSQRFSGLDFALVKRLSNRWMMRLAAGYNDHTEHFDGTPRQDTGQLTAFDASPLQNGGQFGADISGGSGFGDVVMNGKWMVNLNGLYQVGWGVEVAANLFGKQGTPYPIYRAVTLGQDGSNRVMINPGVDQVRFDDLWNLDLRLAKNLSIGPASVMFAADLFNVFNSNTEINRVRNAGSTTFQRLTQNLSPRIFRFGMRLSF
jgi:hypothetical protein